MIVGLGSDVTEISRIAAAYRRYGDIFLRRVLSDTEAHATIHMQDSRKFEFVAGRFAVKEAMAKASGIGLARLHMPSVSVTTTDTGLAVQFVSENHPLQREGYVWHLSISHTNATAFAVALWEQR